MSNEFFLSKLECKMDWLCHLNALVYICWTYWTRYAGYLGRQCEIPNHLYLCIFDSHLFVFFIKDVLTNCAIVGLTWWEAAHLTKCLVKIICVVAIMENEGLEWECSSMWKEHLLWVQKIWYKITNMYLYLQPSEDMNKHWVNNNPFQFGY